MRHRLKGSKLGRTASHRKATLRSLSVALLTHHRIVTTLTKAKELRRHVEPVITRSKDDTTHNRRETFSFLQDKVAVTKLFDEIAPKVADRPGGYTRVVKLGTRVGDGAEMAVIELVDFNESGNDQKTTKKKRTRRAGKTAKTATDVSPTESTVNDANDTVQEATVVNESEVDVQESAPEAPADSQTTSTSEVSEDQVQSEDDTENHKKP